MWIYKIPCGLMTSKWALEIFGWRFSLAFGGENFLTRTGATMLKSSHQDLLKVFCRSIPSPFCRARPLISFQDPQKFGAG